MCLDESSREIQKFVNKSLLLCLTNKACLTILLKRSRREFNIVYIFYCYKAYFCKLPRSGQICLCPPAQGVVDSSNIFTYATLQTLSLAIVDNWASIIVFDIPFRTLLGAKK